jgi:hypothetical protein
MSFSMNSVPPRWSSIRLGVLVFALSSIAVSLLS